MNYTTNFLPLQPVSSSALDNNFLILRDNLECQENLSAQVATPPGNQIFYSSNNFNPSTWSLIQVFVNGIKQRQGIIPIPLDFVVSGSQSITFTVAPTAGQSVEIIYRKAV